MILYNGLKLLSSDLLNHVFPWFTLFAGGIKLPCRGIIQFWPILLTISRLLLAAPVGNVSLSSWRMMVWRTRLLLHSQASWCCPHPLDRSLAPRPWMQGLEEGKSTASGGTHRRSTHWQELGLPSRWGPQSVSCQAGSFKLLTSRRGDTPHSVGVSDQFYDYQHTDTDPFRPPRSSHGLHSVGVNVLWLPAHRHGPIQTSKIITWSPKCECKCFMTTSTQTRTHSDLQDLHMVSTVSVWMISFMATSTQTRTHSYLQDLHSLGVNDQFYDYQHTDTDPFII